MRAGQKLIASDGKEVLLFPLEYMNISQDEGGSTSHAGTYNIDFLGWGANGRVYNCPYYAPCKCVLVYQSLAGYYNIWNSLNEVHTPSGLQRVSFMVVHDNNVPFSVGHVLNQGELMGHTGTGGNVGDHLHLNIASGNYAGQEQVPPDNEWQLINSEHIYNMMYVNDTVIINGENHNWMTYTGPILQTSNKGFNFVLYGYYAKKKRKW